MAFRETEQGGAFIISPWSLISAILLSRLFLYLGEQSEKESDKNKDWGEELADVLFVTLCLANQMGIDLQKAFDKKLQLKTERDRDRHQQNPKLK